MVDWLGHHPSCGQSTYVGKYVNLHLRALHLYLYISPICHQGSSVRRWVRIQQHDDGLFIGENFANISGQSCVVDAENIF